MIGTILRRRPRARRAVLGIAALACLAIALAGLALGGPAEPVTAPVPLSERLAADTWAFAIPLAWLATPVAVATAGDVVDILGARPSERAEASVVASALRVVSVDREALVVELSAEDAEAIARARARALSLIPIVRSRR